MPNIHAESKMAASNHALKSTCMPPTSSAGVSSETIFLGDHSEVRHSIRSIDSGLGESDDPTQVDKVSVSEVYSWRSSYNNGATDIYMHIYMHVYMCTTTCQMTARIWLKIGRYDLQISKSNLG